MSIYDARLSDSIIDTDNGHLRLQLVPGFSLFFWSRAQTLDRSDFFFNLRRVLIFNCQPIGFEHKSLEVRESRVLSLDLVVVCILEADQKESGLWGQNCEESSSTL